jgi:putative FmdB family regulatory protein
LTLPWVPRRAARRASGDHVQDPCWRFAMPTYEYRCETCGEKFEHAEHLAEHPTAHPACPKCGSEKVLHMPTQFVAKTSRKS